MIVKAFQKRLPLFRMELFGPAHEKTPVPKICYAYATMMKHGTLTPYLKKKQYIRVATKNSQRFFSVFQGFFPGIFQIFQGRFHQPYCNLISSNIQLTTNSDKPTSLLPVTLTLLPTHVQLTDGVSFENNSEVN